MQRTAALVWAGVGLCLAVGSPVGAQAPSKAGPREVIDRDREVALALSAAPDAVSDGATVMVWNGDAYEVGVEGRTDVACYVSRSWPDSIEPHCFDAEGSRTILPIHMLQVRLRHEGLEEAAIDAELSKRIARGELHLPTRPAMSYMMSEGQKLISDDGRPVGAWQPHVMLYYPNLTSEGMGLRGEPSADAAVVTEPGTPYSSVMVVVRAFVPVREGGPGAR